MESLLRRLSELCCGQGDHLPEKVWESFKYGKSVDVVAISLLDTVEVLFSDSTKTLNFLSKFLSVAGVIW